jgi:hypothetical protein
MKLKSIKPARPVPHNALVVEAYLSSEHDASSQGKPVLVIQLSNGTEKTIGPAEAGLAGYHILKASETEIRELRDAGYLLPYAPPEG